VPGKGGKNWDFRYTPKRKSREMGLSPVGTFSLAEARDQALTCRKLRSAGVDPIEMRRERRQDAAVEAAKAITFWTCAEGYKTGWRNDKHAAQWSTTVVPYTYPLLGDLPVGAARPLRLGEVRTPIHQR
jgi:hypothetical protein